MRSTLVTSCALGATLLLTACSGGSGEQPEAGRASAAVTVEASASADPSAESTASVVAPATSAPATSAPTPSAPTAKPVSRAEREARITALTDLLGDPLQLVSAEQAAAGLEIVQSAMEGADVQPAECKDHATGNIAGTGELAADAVSGIGAADELGGYLAVVLLDGSAEGAARDVFQVGRRALVDCAVVAATIQGTTVISTTEELPLHLTGEESFAVRMTQEVGSEQVFQTLSVTARGNGVIANVQAMSPLGLDGITQDDLAALAAQLLQPAGP